MIAFRFHRISKGVARLLALSGLLVMQSGCATYYSHYAMFPAENSQGEPRTVRLSWHSAEYPSWWFVSDRATPLTLETQCSERAWRLYDGSHAEAGACGQGIRACGESASDRLVQEQPSVNASDACMLVNPSDSEARIADISGRLELLVACEPVSAVKGEGKDAVNVDYIRASTVPYTVYTRKTPRGSLSARPPKFDRSVCNAD
ncbi:hypothetical protein SAMN04488490_1426 [Marinobacter sp. LV10R510-11A]|uniref:hypothetical protein n=1 Tax=Marinobacter sp. LV10R510-11A TaxID=1415568 RepID=UPI000BC04330|nr:hypothetical protein [Marinobacter sp. LV10R510-11A]SOB75787.1 hypothetical protein SAMN04488490_1426 [Marinobacter sp. LV10R510-11A]